MQLYPQLPYLTLQHFQHISKLYTVIILELVLQELRVQFLKVGWKGSKGMGYAGV